MSSSTGFVGIGSGFLCKVFEIFSMTNEGKGGFFDLSFTISISLPFNTNVIW